MRSSAEVFNKLKNGVLQRILAFGSSNTAHFLSGMHWFDCLDLALSQTYDRNHRSINTGIGGHTTSDLLGRFEQDAAFYRPHMVIITIGGNDSNPNNTITVEQYCDNLIELHRRFTQLECAVVFQTYYAPYSMGEDTSHVDLFHTYMDAMRDVAKKLDIEMIDQLALWEPFRVKHNEEYMKLMQDGFHVNYRGNMVMGMHLARTWGLNLGTDRPEYWQETERVYGLMGE